MDFCLDIINFGLEQLIIMRVAGKEFSEEEGDYRLAPSSTLLRCVVRLKAVWVMMTNRS